MLELPPPLIFSFLCFIIYNMINTSIKKNLAQIVGKGYGDWWRFKGRYRFTIGSRGSKKSCTCSLYFIYMLHKLPLSNLLVIRRFFNTHRDSTFKQLKWAMKMLGVDKYWHCTNQPLEMTNILTGQKILFKGMDDVDSITSITTDNGFINFVWFEEFYQCSNETDFDRIDMSIRGERPEGYFNQITFSMNPWSDNFFGKKRFYDIGITHNDPNYFACCTNYMCNEHLSNQDIQLFEWMKINSPKRYAVEGLGQWGRTEGLIYNKVIEKDFDYRELMAKHDNYGKRIFRKCYGLDFGFKNDPTALSMFLANENTMEIYIYGEWYKYGATNMEIANKIKELELTSELIYADSAEPKSIEELHLFGCPRVIGARKGKDSVIAGIQKLQDYTIYVHPSCTNHIIEFNNYAYDTDPDTGKQINNPIDEYNHLMDALRYGSQDINYKNFLWAR